MVSTDGGRLTIHCSFIHPSNQGRQVLNLPKFCVTLGPKNYASSLKKGENIELGIRLKDFDGGHLLIDHGSKAHFHGQLNRNITWGMSRIIC